MDDYEDSPSNGIKVANGKGSKKRMADGLGSGDISSRASTPQAAKAKKKKVAA